MLGRPRFSGPRGPGIIVGCSGTLWILKLQSIHCTADRATMKALSTKVPPNPERVESGPRLRYTESMEREGTINEH